MEEDILFDLLREREEYNKLNFYIENFDQIKNSINEIIDQIDDNISKITTQILAIS